MARLGRYFLADQPVHVIQRGNDRQAIFFHDNDYACYRRLLAGAARHHGCAVHAYVLMTNHVHLLLTPGTADGPSRMMQWLGVRYVRHINTTYRRTGTLWEGRFRAAPIESESHLLTCYRYIELNPVRAGMVAGRRTIHGRATAPMRRAPPTPWCATIRCLRRLGDGSRVPSRLPGAVPGGAAGNLDRRTARRDERRLGGRERAVQGTNRRRLRSPRCPAAQGPAGRRRRD